MAAARPAPVQTARPSRCRELHAADCRHRRGSGGPARAARRLSRYSVPVPQAVPAGCLDIRRAQLRAKQPDGHLHPSAHERERIQNGFVPLQHDRAKLALGDNRTKARRQHCFYPARNRRDHFMLAPAAPLRKQPEPRSTRSIAAYTPCVSTNSTWCPAAANGAAASPCQREDVDPLNVPCRGSRRSAAQSSAESRR